MKILVNVYLGSKRDCIEVILETEFKTKMKVEPTTYRTCVYKVHLIYRKLKNFCESCKISKIILLLSFNWRAVLSKEKRFFPNQCLHIYKTFLIN